MRPSHLSKATHSITSFPKPGYISILELDTLSLHTRRKYHHSPMETEKTEAVYQKDGHLYSHTSTLSSLSPLTSLPAAHQSLFKPPPDATAPYVLATRSTIFHAQGGGQPSDTGTMTPTAPPEASPAPTFVVHQVRKVDPQILHLGTFSPAETTFSNDAPGMELQQSIDVPTRVLHSKWHTAGHALGLAIYQLSREGVLASGLHDGKASHYPGTAFVEFEGLIMGDSKAAIQERVDKLVGEDHAVSIHFWSEEEAGKKCIGGTDGAAISGDEVRVVDIGGLGSYPCGGTHVRTLKELGRVVVRNIKRQKGISKISYEVVDA